jgi:hypothetical protein
MEPFNDKFEKLLKDNHIIDINTQQDNSVDIKTIILSLNHAMKNNYTK